MVLCAGFRVWGPSPLLNELPRASCRLRPEAPVDFRLQRLVSQRLGEERRSPHAGGNLRTAVAGDHDEGGYIARAQLRLDQAGDGRRVVVRGGGGDNNQVKFLGRQSGFLQRALSGGVLYLRNETTLAAWSLSR